MNKRFSSILLFFLSLVMTVPVQAAVVINEIVPKTDPSTGEWVELYNNGSDSVSLNQWKLDHTAGDGKSFILNAGAIIQPHGFLTFTGSQSAISFSIDGDTVRLFDANNSLVDSQSYPGTLGYNTSMGRSADGGGTWAICSTATYNTNNNCPQPSPTPTPLPTSIPTTAPNPTATPTPQPKADRPLADTPAAQSFGSIMITPTKTQVLGAATIPSPTPTPMQEDVLLFKIDKMWIVYVLMGMAAVALSLMLAMLIRQHQIRK